MKAGIALLMAALLSAWLLGCATQATAYDDSKVAQIKKDTTSEAQLVDWFGPPASRAMAPDGSKMLTWKFSSGNSHVMKAGGRLEVRLGADGKVGSYSASAGR